MRTNANGVVVEAISKSYGDTKVLEDVSLAVPRGEFHALLGPSGSGKTTILRVIAGFTAADAGRVVVSERDVSALSAERRNIGVVFQNYALFPHMSVAQNVGFGLKMRGFAKSEIGDRVHAALQMVHLEDYGRRRPEELSGGQQQRVALARALVIEPDLLLLDEPLSALDRKIRQSVREELKRIQSETGVTTIIVTHDQEEALFLSDKMLVLDRGSVRQTGSPADVYRIPVDEFVAGFVGELNVLQVRLERTDDGLAAVIADQRLVLPSHMGLSRRVGENARLTVRPEELTIAPGEDVTGLPHMLQGTLLAVDFAGPVVSLHVGIGGQKVTALALSPSVIDNHAYCTGARVTVAFNPRGLNVMPPRAEVA